MFGSIGPTELLLIFIVALLVFGPKKLPEIGKSVGKAIREFKKASDEIKGRIEDEIQASELKDVHKDVQSGLNSLQSGVKGFQDRLKQTMGLDDTAQPAASAAAAGITSAPDVPKYPYYAETPAPPTETIPAGDPAGASSQAGTAEEAAPTGASQNSGNGSSSEEAAGQKDNAKKDLTTHEAGEGH